MRKFLFTIALMLVLAGQAAGQGGKRQTSTVIRPTAAIGGASVRVCTEAATGTPCSPLATIYSDKALTTPIAGSIVTADTRGNYGYFATPGCYVEQASATGFSAITQTICVSIDPSDNVAFTGNNSGSGTWTLASLNGHFWAGPGTTPTIATQEAAAAAAGGGVVDIAQGYTGAESGNCTLIDGLTVWTGNSAVSIVDWRSGSSACVYTLQMNSATPFGLTPVNGFKRFSSPSTTASAGIFTANYTGNLSAGGGNLNGITAEVNVDGTLSAPPTASVVGLLSEAHVRSLTQTIPDLVGVSASASIDRAATTTNITRAIALRGNASINSSASGATISEAYSLFAARQTVGTARNYSVYSAARMRLGYFSNDNGLDLESTTGVPSNILQNDGTDTVSYRPLTDSKGFAWKAASGAVLMQLDVGNNSLQTRAIIADQGLACTNGELALSAGWQSTGSATVTAVAGNGQTCSWTITTGTTTAANPTITDTLTNVLPAATTVCWMNIYGGTHTAVAGESLRQTTLSATAPIFTANFTPTAGGTTYFVTRGCGP